MGRTLFTVGFWHEIEELFLKIYTFLIFRPIPENPNQEILILEVWDFDAAETIGEKVNKLFEVKGVKGLRKLMKEIAVTASTGKHDNELIGRTSIPLKVIMTVMIILFSKYCR